MEQRYQAVLEVLSGVPVTEVAQRYGVSRKQVYVWLRRYREEGVPGLVDRSHRPRSHPWQLDPEIESALVGMRLAHPRWGPRRLAFELERAGFTVVPSRSTIYRVLVRRQLVAARPRKRHRGDYRRWERDVSMELWQMDVMGSVRLVDGSEAKLISGIDDHSRYSVVAVVVARATGPAVCRAFTDALCRFGLPEQVLTDNGRQFTGKYSRPQASEVLFDRICRKNGIDHLLTKVRTPTTTGKVERWHQTIQREFLDDHPPFECVTEAQEAVTAWQAEYNASRPHQSLDMSFPVDRFAPATDRPVMWLPAGMGAVSSQPAVSVARAAAAIDVAPTAVEAEERAAEESPGWDPDAVAPSAGSAGAVEIERVVPPSGNLTLVRQQLWFGPQRAGEILTFWVDATTIFVSSNGRMIKQLPSRLSERDLTRLARSKDARAAGPAPARPLWRPTPGQPVAVDRTVNRVGQVSLGNQQLGVGIVLAGQRVTIRLEGRMADVALADGTLWRSVPFDLPEAKVLRLQGAHPAGPRPASPEGPMVVERHVSERGGIQVAKQRVQVGLPWARQYVRVEVEDTALRIIDGNGTVVKVVPRLIREEVTRTKAYGHRSVRQA